MKKKKQNNSQDRLINHLKIFQKDGKKIPRDFEVDLDRLAHGEIASACLKKVYCLTD